MSAHGAQCDVNVGKYRVACGEINGCFVSFVLGCFISGLLADTHRRNSFRNCVLSSLSSWRWFAKFPGALQTHAIRGACVCVFVCVACARK